MTHREYITAHLSETWTVPVYALFRPVPEILHDPKGRCAHGFYCKITGCNKIVRQYLDTADPKSTTNLYKHVKVCWGEEAYKAAAQQGFAKDTQPAVERFKCTRSILQSFQRSALLERESLHT